MFGAGYVGGAVAAAAIRQGARVTALTRNASKVALLAAEGCDVVVDELSSDSWHAKLRTRADLVLNCVSSGGGGIEGYRRSYVGGMGSILSWLGKRGPVDTMVYTGSTSVYPQSGGAWVDETAPVGGEVGLPAVLLEAEALLRAAPKNLCTRWFILRLAGIYGPGRHRLLDQLREGVSEFPGQGGHRLNLIHRDDIVAAVLAAFRAPAAVLDEIFNVADDGRATKSEVVSWLAEQLGGSPPVFNGEPVTGRRATTPDRLISNGKLKSLLGWQPRYPDFRAGFRPLLEA